MNDRYHNTFTCDDRVPISSAAPAPLKSSGGVSPEGASSSTRNPEFSATLNGSRMNDRYHNTFSCDDRVPMTKVDPRTTIGKTAGAPPAEPAATGAGGDNVETAAAESTSSSSTPQPAPASGPTEVYINDARVNDRYHNTFSCDDVPPPKVTPRITKAASSIPKPQSD
mmetsp:Transcript_19199/g.38709  ORF Transcript_19199/g.38709 Transcript_19199/m.38709 type:complete len:168 (+) Transcript_19199:1-504(+)